MMRQEGNPQPIEFDPELFAAVTRNVLLPLTEHVDTQRPLAVWAKLLQVWNPAMDYLFQAKPPAEILYYVLMVGRDVLPQFVPVHDICLMAANMLSDPVQPGGHLFLLDWELLPAAVLTARFPHAELQITLPPCRGASSGQAGDAEKILVELQKRLPHVVWGKAAKNEPELAEGSIVLGQNPLLHSERDSSFLEELEGIKSGVFSSTWDFLGVKIHAHTRSCWLKTGLIRSVLQLPRPRRQGTTAYPALILVGEGDGDSTSIRMARIASCRPGPGALNIPQTLSLLKNEADGINATDVPVEAIARDGLFDLSPALYLAQSSLPVQAGGTLRQYAQVLRCQLPRERIENVLSPPEDDEWAGEYLGGTFIGREVSLGELDPLTGFLDEHGGNIVQLELTRHGKQGKYLLRSGDILFAFRGTQASVGQVGFVEEEGIPGITGQSLCIIRPLPGTEPVWLYYYLQRKTIREWIRGRASGSTLLTVNLESIRDIPVAYPDAAEITAVNEEHWKIADIMATITQQKRKVFSSLRRIRELGESAEKISAGRV